MCRAVLPHFKALGRGKVVQLSWWWCDETAAADQRLCGFEGGGIRFIETLAEELRENHIDVNAIAPGALNTRMLNEVLDAGPQKVGKVFTSSLSNRARWRGPPSI